MLVQWFWSSPFLTWQPRGRSAVMWQLQKRQESIERMAFRWSTKGRGVEKRQDGSMIEISWYFLTPARSYHCKASLNSRVQLAELWTVGSTRPGEPVAHHTFLSCLELLGVVVWHWRVSPCLEVIRAARSFAVVLLSSPNIFSRKGCIVEAAWGKMGLETPSFIFGVRNLGEAGRSSSSKAMQTSLTPFFPDRDIHCNWMCNYSRLEENLFYYSFSDKL